MPFQARSDCPNQIEADLLRSSALTSRDGTTHLLLSFVVIKLYFFGTYLARVEAPVGTLVVFVAVQAAAGNPFTVFEGAVLDSAYGDLCLALGGSGEENAEALAD